MRNVFALLVAGLCLLGAAASAGYHGVDVDDVAEFDILHGWRTENGTQMAALRIRLAPGWKTYWRAPGDAGIPPVFDWRRSRNLKSVRYHWPVPEVHVVNGLQSIGYSGEFILPIEFAPKTRGKDMMLRARIQLGVCEDVCIPVSVRVAADIAGDGASDARIKSAIRARPDTATEAGMTSVRCQVDPIADGLRLTARIELPQISQTEVTVFELPDRRIWVSQASTNRRGPMLTASADLVPPSGKPFALDRSAVRITVIGQGRAVDIRGCSG